MKQNQVFQFQGFALNRLVLVSRVSAGCGLLRLSESNVVAPVVTLRSFMKGF